MFEKLLATRLRHDMKSWPRLLRPGSVLAAGLAAGTLLNSGGASQATAQEYVSAPAVASVTRQQLDSDLLVVHEGSPKVVDLQPLDESDTPPVVTAMAADLLGKYLAIAGDDHAVRIYSVEQGKVIYTGKAHQDWIQSLVFGLPDPDSDRHAPKLYSAGDDGIVYCWEAGRPPVAITQFQYAIRSLSLSPQQQLLAIGGFDNAIVLFDLARGNFSRRLECDCGDQRTVSFSPDGSRILCGGRDGEVNVWSTQTGQMIASYKAHRGRIHTAGFSSNGSQITSVGDDRRLVQYDLESQTGLPASLNLPSKLMAMSLINDSVVAVAGADNSIQLYDFKTRRVVADLKSHEGSVSVLCPFSKLLASGSFDTTVRIWDLESIESKLRAKQQPVSFSPLDIDDKLRIR